MNILSLNKRFHTWLEALGHAKSDLVVSAILSLFTFGPLVLATICPFFAKHAVATACTLLILAALSALEATYHHE